MHSIIMKKKTNLQSVGKRACQDSPGMTTSLSVSFSLQQDSAYNVQNKYPLRSEVRAFGSAMPLWRTVATSAGVAYRGADDRSRRSRISL